MPLPTIDLSKTLLSQALKLVQDQLLLDSNTPISLLLYVQSALDSVTYENNPDEYWCRWLQAGGNSNLETFQDAKALFSAGFNFCQEQLEYEFGLEY